MAERKLGYNLLFYYVALAFAMGSVLTFIISAYYGSQPAATSAQQAIYGMTMNPSSDLMQAYRNTLNVDCSNVTDSRLMEIGDQAMGEMMADDGAHQAMDQSTPNINETHLVIGRIATGCYNK